ncbi:MAG: hypothetical protein HC829_08460 [Bacteroidales bacterium]|nr:hypothetical protein [Bacteroidales bacterium]
MLRFLVRLVGFLLLAGGFAALVIDGTRSIAVSAVTVTRAGDAWYALSPSTLNLVQAATERYAAPWLWDPMLVSLLFVPVFVLLGGAGFLLLVIGRQPATPIGWSSRD